MSKLSNFNYSDTKTEPDLCSGKGLTLAQAKVGALGEAVERYCASQYDDKKLQFKSFKTVESAITPLDLVLYSEEQYNSRSIPFERFSEETIFGWTKARSLNTGREIQVPAISVFMDYEPTNPNELILQPTSNGLAAGATYEQAVLGGLLELIERDAFMITWLCKLPMPLLNLAFLQDKCVRDLIRMYNSRGVQIYLISLILDTPIPTFMAIASDITEKGRPAAAVGLSAHPNPETAILKSILEVGQIRPRLLHEMRNPDYSSKIAKLMDFENVKTLEDHDLLYTDSKMFTAFNFLIHNGNCVNLSDLPNFSGTITEELGYCRKFLNRAGVDVLSVDVTTSDISDLKLFVCRVIIPHFQPIHFGFNMCRLGGNRLFELPEKLGYYDHRLDTNELNTFPHPFA